MSIRTGLHIIEVLNANRDITDYVGDRIYPVVIPMGTTEYPFITILNEGSGPESTKDGDLEDNVICRVAVVDKSYTDVLEYGSIARYAIDGKTGQYEEFRVTECEFASWQEDYNIDIDAYVVTMTFEIKTIDY